MAVVVINARELKEAARALRKHANGKVLRLEMTRGIRDEVRPVVKAVKGAYGGGKHLRPALRRATGMQVKTGGKGVGVRVKVDGRKMPAGMGSLPAYREGQKAPWRHPVFGNPEVWVSQSPVPVFYRTVEPYVDKVQRRVTEIVEEIAERVAHG